MFGLFEGRPKPKAENPEEPTITPGSERVQKAYDSAVGNTGRIIEDPARIDSFDQSAKKSGEFTAEDIKMMERVMEDVATDEARNDLRGKDDDAAQAA